MYVSKCELLKLKKDILYNRQERSIKFYYLNLDHQKLNI
jgi:hypothetical protein